MITINDLRVEYSPGNNVILSTTRPGAGVVLSTAAEVLALSEILRIYGKQMEETEMARHVRMYARRTPP